MASEHTLLRRIQVSASKVGARLFRNNVGIGWAGDMTRFVETRTITVYPGDTLIRKARPLHAGLCIGSSDLIGLTPLVIQPDHVGRRFAVFTANEVKTPGVAITDEQENFINMVRELGGIGIISYAVEDTLRGMVEFTKRTDDRIDVTDYPADHDLPPDPE